MIAKLVLAAAAALAMSPALAQTPTAQYAMATSGEVDVIGDLLAKAEADVAPRVGLTVRAASGAPVGDIARVGHDAVVIRLLVRDRTALKRIGHEHLEVRGESALSDLTVAELQALPEAQAE